MILPRRLPGENVDARSGDAPFLQRADQRGFVHDRPAGGIDEIRARLHQRQQARVDQAAGLRVEQRVDRNEIPLRHDRFERGRLDAQRRGALRRTVRIVGQQAAENRCRAPCGTTPRRSCPDRPRPASCPPCPRPRWACPLASGLPACVCPAPAVASTGRRSRPSPLRRRRGKSPSGSARSARRPRLRRQRRCGRTRLPSARCKPAGRRRRSWKPENSSASPKSRRTPEAFPVGQRLRAARASLPTQSARRARKNSRSAGPSKASRRSPQPGSTPTRNFAAIGLADYTSRPRSPLVPRRTAPNRAKPPAARCYNRQNRRHSPPLAPVLRSTFHFPLSTWRRAPAALALALHWTAPPPAPAQTDWERLGVRTAEIRLLEPVLREESFAAHHAAFKSQDLGQTALLALPPIEWDKQNREKSADRVPGGRPRPRLRQRRDRALPRNRLRVRPPRLRDDGPPASAGTAASKATLRASRSTPKAKSSTCCRPRNSCASCPTSTPCA